LITKIIYICLNHGEVRVENLAKADEGLGRAVAVGLGLEK